MISKGSKLACRRLIIVRVCGLSEIASTHLSVALANSGALLHDVFELVDTSGDGRIEYEGQSEVQLIKDVADIFAEFRTFVEQTEKELWQLFKSIDRDRSGTLDKDELRAAFKNAGVDMNSSKLERFFSEIDKNNDGSISFDEWRLVSLSRAMCCADHSQRLSPLPPSTCAES